MLPSHLTVSLSASSVTVINQSTGLRGRVIQRQHIPIIQNVGEPAWQLAINKFENLLASMQVKSKTRLHVVLASDFVRYLTLPPQPIAMSSAERLAYAIAAYREVYGAVADGWDVRLDDTAPNKVIMVAAIDEKLLEALSQISLKYQLKLNNVQPYLMSAFNNLRNQLCKISGCLVILEVGRLLMIRIHQGQYQNLRIGKVNDMESSDWQAELKQLLMRELLLGDVTGKEVLIYAPTQKNTAIKPIEGWKIRRIGQASKNIGNDRFFDLIGATA